MSLVAFHRVLILTAIAFCLGFAAWELLAYSGGDGSVGSVLIAALFALLAAGLTVYLVRLRSILQLDD